MIVDVGVDVIVIARVIVDVDLDVDTHVDVGGTAEGETGQLVTDQNWLSIGRQYLEP